MENEQKHCAILYLLSTDLDCAVLETFSILSNYTYYKRLFNWTIFKKINEKPQSENLKNLWLSILKAEKAINY